MDFQNLAHKTIIGVVNIDLSSLVVNFLDEEFYPLWKLDNRMILNSFRLRLEPRKEDEKENENPSSYFT